MLLATLIDPPVVLVQRGKRQSCQLSAFSRQPEEASVSSE
jgi:hypothetical protein